MKHRAWLLFTTCISLSGLSQSGSAGDRMESIKTLLKEAGKEVSYGHFETGQKKYDQALEQSKAMEYRNGIVAWYDGSILIQCQQRETGKAMVLAHAFSEWANKKNDPRELAYAAFQFGIIYRLTANYDSSFYFLEQTLKQLSGLKEPGLEAKVYSAMLTNYTRMEMPDNGLAYGKKAMDIYRSLNDSIGIAKTYIFLGNAYNLLEQDDNWRNSLWEGLRLAKALNNPLLLMYAWNNLSQYHTVAGVPDSVLPCLEQAYRIAGQEHHMVDRNEYAINMARQYNVLQQYEQALRLLDTIYADTATHQLHPQKLHLAQLAHFQALKGLGHYKEASDIMEQYIALSGKIYQDESRQKALEMDERLKRSEQEQQLAQKKWQLKKQKLWLLALGFALAAAALLILFLRKKQQADRHRMQKEKELEKMKALLDGQSRERIRIAKELHDDLGSSLTAIGLLTEVLQQQPEYRDNPQIARIAASTHNTIDSMNELIWAINTNNDTLNSLLAHIRKFATEFLQPAGIELVVNEEGVQQDHPLGNMARRNIYLAVKEALHNIVKHAGAKKVTIGIQVNQNLLTLLIADDGMGFTPGNNNGNGQGVQNMNTRMQETGGTWELVPGNGTTVKLTCPLNATTGEANLS